MKLRRDESGMVGKIIAIWMVVVVLFGVVALDTFSIIFTKFRLSSAASVGASTAANTYKASKSISEACDEAERAILDEDPSANMPKSFCRIDTSTGEATIVLRKVAGTILAQRLSFTEELTRVSAKEQARPATL